MINSDASYSIAVCLLCVRSTFADFCHRHGKDDRFRGMEKSRERESLFNEFIIEVRRKEKEERDSQREKVLFPCNLDSYNLLLPLPSPNFFFLKIFNFILRTLMLMCWLHKYLFVKLSSNVCARLKNIQKDPPGFFLMILSFFWKVLENYLNCLKHFPDFSGIGFRRIFFWYSSKFVEISNHLIE